jgi:hypothetical protein
LGRLGREEEERKVEKGADRWGPRVSEGKKREARGELGWVRLGCWAGWGKEGKGRESGPAGEKKRKWAEGCWAGWVSFFFFLFLFFSISNLIQTKLNSNKI